MVDIYGSRYARISTTVYNLIIGGLIFYGLLLNVLMVHFLSDKVADINTTVFLIAYLVSCIAGVFLTLSDHPVVSFIGYNLIVVPIGILLCICLPEYPASSIELAAGLTAFVTLAMIVIATIRPSIFEGLGRTLLVSLILGLVAEIFATLFGYRGDFFNWLFVIIFSLYVGYDWQKAQGEAKTIDNAVDAAVNIYLDIINIFVRLLGSSKSKSSRK